MHTKTKLKDIIETIILVALLILAIASCPLIESKMDAYYDKKMMESGW